MSATFAPFGMRPVYHPSGLDRASAYANGIYYDPETVVDNVATGYPNNIYKGEPVKAYGNGWIAPPDFNSTFIGAFAGVEWTDSTGRRRVSNYWPGGQQFIVGSVVVYVYDDPNIVYEMQMNGPIPAFPTGSLIAQYNFADKTSGSPGTGLSSCSLDSTAPSGAPGDIFVKYVAPYPGNALEDQYPIVRGTISFARYQYNDNSN
jgi:hypothetical protein